MYLIGDFNLNVLDYETNTKVKKKFNLIFQHGLIPVINKPTRVTRKSATAIDHIITNSISLSNFTTGIIKTDMTDHMPIFLINSKINIDVYAEDTYIFKRYINEKSIANFKTLIKMNDWEYIKDINCPNTAYDTFLRNFLNLYEPKVKIKIKTKYLLSPWIAKGLVISSKRKHKLYDKFLKKRTYKNETTYKNYKHLFEKLKFKSKQSYYKNLIFKNKNNIKKTWAIINEVINKTNMKKITCPEV